MNNSLSSFQWPLFRTLTPSVVIQFFPIDRCYIPTCNLLRFFQLAFMRCTIPTEPMQLISKSLEKYTNLNF